MGKSIAGLLGLCVFLTLAPSSRGTAQSPAVSRDVVSLSGEWRFAVDPAGEGERDRWFAPELDELRWDRVNVPHCWPVDPRYQYTGRAWYRRTFASPDGVGDRHVRIEFDAVFARARVWLNGALLGAHEGGYTPFGFDVTRALAAGKQNVVVLEVDNSWSTKTMPGARPGTEPAVRVYPWWDYGGIVRPVALVVSPAVYIEKQRITTAPDLASGAAAIEAAVWVHNTTARPASSRLRLTIVRLEGDREIALPTPAATWQASADTPPGETKPVTAAMQRRRKLGPRSNSCLFPRRNSAPSRPTPRHTCADEVRPVRPRRVGLPHALRQAGIGPVPSR